jgi:hypothetical protein
MEESYGDSTEHCNMWEGFSKQNLINSHLHTSLKLEMRISCANIIVENINWNAVMLVWRNMKDRKPNIHFFEGLVALYFLVIEHVYI